MGEERKGAGGVGVGGGEGGVEGVVKGCSLPYSPRGV